MSRPRGIGEFLAGIVGVYPCRCQKCAARFRVSLWTFGDFWYARCPRCYRFELTNWAVDKYRPSAGTTLLLNLGARPVRCEGCRCNFASYRFIKQRYRRLRTVAVGQGSGAAGAQIGDGALKARSLSAEDALESGRTSTP